MKKIIGGQDPSVSTLQQNTAQYSAKGMNSGYVRTNEQHFFDLSTGKSIYTCTTINYY